TDGALVAIDPKTGAVLAMVGSAGANVPGGEYNMAVIPRQPGSAFKMFTYTAAIESDRKSTRLNSSHLVISYAVFCLKKKNTQHKRTARALIPRLYTKIRRSGRGVRPLRT